MTAFCRIKDKKILYMHITFLQGYGFTILKVLYMYTSVEQISKYIVDNEGQLEIRK